MDKIEGLKGQSFCTKVKKAVKPVGKNLTADYDYMAKMGLSQYTNDVEDIVNLIQEKL